jgi:hypothetical protein
MTGAFPGRQGRIIGIPFRRFSATLLPAPRLFWELSRSVIPITPIKTEQRKWTESLGWTPVAPGPIANSCPLVLVSGDTSVLRKADLMAAIRRDYPATPIFGCSTAGEIGSTAVSAGTLAGTTLAGFYSNGEISPFTPGAPCELHNQTMTITALSEK